MKELFEIKEHSSTGLNVKWYNINVRLKQCNDNSNNQMTA